MNTKIFRNSFVLCVLSILCALCVACTADEFDGADPNGIPNVQGVDFQLSVDQETNQMVATYNAPAGTYPLWILDGAAYSTLPEVGYKNTEAGTHTIELKLGNRNGFSQGGVKKSYTFNETKIDYTADFRRITGKEWRIDNKEKAHMGCGEAGTDGSGWWAAGPDEKKDFGVYDDRITFTADNRKGGTYTYNAGDDGMTYVNWGASLHPTGTEPDADVALGNQTSTWSFEELDWTDKDGNTTKQRYIRLAANTLFPYISSDAQYEDPLFRVEQLTASKMVLVYDKPDRSIAWRFVLTSKEGEKEFTGFDANSDFNMWKGITPTMEFWYAPGWAQIADPEFKDAGNDYTITLPEATTDQWQAQVKFHTDLTTSAANNYDFSAVFNSDKDLNGATVKLVLDGDDGVFYFTDRIDLKAGQDYIFWKSDMPGIDMPKVMLVLDFGGCQAGTTVNVSNIVLKDHANDDGTKLPDVTPDNPDQADVDWDVNSSTNLWAPVESGDAFINVTPWFADNGWSQIGAPEWSHDNGVWTLTIPEGMGGNQWQGQFPINTTLTAAQSKKYNFYCVVEADQDCNGVTIKLTETDEADGTKHDGNFFFADRHDVKADVPFVYKAEGVSLSQNDAHALSLFFDFGGSPIGTNIKISKIFFEEDVSLSYDDPANLWRAVDEGSAFAGYFYYMADQGWSPIAYQEATHSGNTYTLTLPDGLGGSQWQGQFAIHSTVAAAQSDKYSFSCTITADMDLPGVTIKLVETDDADGTKHDSNFFFAERHDVKADEPYVYTVTGQSLPLNDAHAVSLWLDFGGSPAGANVAISDIILIKE